MATAAPSPPAEYTQLTELLREISALSSASGVLAWDEQTMLPPGASTLRAKQKAALAGVTHEKATSSELAAAISASEKIAGTLDEFARANVRDARRGYEHTTRVSKKLAMEKETAESAGFNAWLKARESNDFASLAPVLRDGLDVFKRYATATRPEMDPYDAAIDIFERGMTAERLQVLFDEMKAPLKDLLDRVWETKKTMPPVHEALRGGEGWNVDKQAALCRELAEKITFDFDSGRIDVSAHPFTMGVGAKDVRITTRYNKNKPFEGIMGTVHEVGHALYEQGANNEHEGLPVASPLSMGAHESQSLFWERMVALTPAFWEAVTPLMHKQLPVTKSATADDFAYAVNQIDKHGLIRVDADELSYPFHIMMRFEIERGLFDGSIQMEQLPDIWRSKTKEYFDVDVPDDAKGCMQDVHWPSLAWGYFPSYTLGAMTAAQLYAFMDREALPGMEQRIARGEFGDIKKFLNDNFHKFGSLYTSVDDLLIKVTGEPLKVSYFIDYLTKKYTTMYKL